MRVYLWESGAWCGVSDDPGAAMNAAGACVAGGAAACATVEAADARLAGPRREAGYVRLGRGWTGRLDEGRVAWTPARPCELAVAG